MLFVNCNERKLKESMNVLVVMMKGVKPGVVTYEALIDENGLVIQVNKAKYIFYASVR